MESCCIFDPWPLLSFSRADACNGLDLDEDFRRGEAADLDERGAGKIIAEQLLARAPYFGVLFDVDDGGKLGAENYFLDGHEKKVL